ncbi:MAG: VCBS repeat-containing protein [Nitrospira sp.]|nr:VCBS repeat-containing protein [Nitrospira sp.]MCA9474813.1 VCBS repeat-containing protein [Nitrospira sp.]MCA9481261.1 VCBS repeat-containing protein [Nitrospira sp.]MCB9711042.1 VCBS repeat-containing protein [Nitrospiraceae bacterium]MDR4488163.1 FG-GAP-like repeat-containing protein [Nitrospirales bacterium]
MNTFSVLIRSILLSGVVLGVGGLWLSPTSHAQNLTYTPTPSNPVGRAPQAITSGDFNGDGLWDVATVNGTSDDVSVLLGNGNGTFRGAVSFGVGKIPLALVAEDMDRDGHLDLVLALSGSDQVVVLKGEGTGLFHKLDARDAGKGTTFLAVQDLNGDGWSDVVAVNSGRFGYYPPFNLSVLMNDGKGGLLAPISYDQTDRDGMFPTGVLVEDMTGDGKPDLTVTWSQPSWRSPNGLVSLLKNAGDGTFVLEKEFKPGFTLSSIQGADLNHDGLADLAVTSLYSDTIRILLQREGGTFTELDPIKVGFAPVGAIFRDFDGDHELDLAVVNRDSNSVSMFLGNGKGLFTSAGHFGVGATPSAVVVEDFDRDQFPDLAAASTNSDGVSVLLSGGGAIPLPSVSTDALVFEADMSRKPSASAQTIRLSNIGLGLLKIVEVGISGHGAEAFALSENTCAGVTLQTGDSCTLDVGFVPHDSGSHHATLTIQDNASGSPRRVALKGLVKG